jgi:hypothetical protein
MQLGTLLMRIGILMAFEVLLRPGILPRFFFGSDRRLDLELLGEARLQQLIA